MSTAEMTLDAARTQDIPISDLLKRKRLDRGFDLADIARETRIPLRHLNALEGGNFASLPALAYSVGFVRTYARYLGLDPDAAARQYKAETTQVEVSHDGLDPEMDTESHQPSRKTIVLSLAAVGAIAAAALIFTALRSSETDESAPAEAAPSAADSSAGAPPPVLSDSAAPPVQDTIAPPPQPDQSAAALPGSGNPSAAPAMPSATGPVVPSVPTVGLVLRAKEDSWIKVSDGGPVSLKIGILKAGETYSVPQIPNLRLQTGNAGGLDVIYNGRMLPPLGNKGEVLRNKPLDPVSLAAAPAAQ